MEQPLSVMYEYDEEIEQEGRVRSDDEISAFLRSQRNLLFVEDDTRLRNLLFVSLGIGVATGFWLSSREVVQVLVDRIDRSSKAVDFTMSSKSVERPPDPNRMEKPQAVAQAHRSFDAKSIRKPKSFGNTGRNNGGGSTAARVTKTGVLGLLAGKITGTSVADADIFGRGGFTKNIDAFIQGKGGLKSGSDGGVGRKGAAGIGFNTGNNSGMDGGDGVPMSIDAMLGDLMQPVELSAKNVALVNRSKHESGTLAIASGAGALTGGRSRESIMRVVLENLTVLRYAYNKRLREKPGLKGKVTVKFAIDENGKVVFCGVIESSMTDPELEGVVVEKIKRWVFDKIDKPGDITEIVYPFVFSS